MLVRYKTSKTGAPVKQAHIFTAAEHRIRKTEVDPDALKVAARLKAAGHSTYIVGGAVRDLMLGKKPKDFDIVTDATPGRIRRLFRNSRVIGRRFRLVHVFFPDKIVEVSTFRSEESGGFMNVFGEIEEDAKRRDFTANALFYDPDDETVVDYVGGFEDVRAHRLRPIIPLDRIFSEDPVRMIRAVKYSTTGGLKMGFSLRKNLRKSVSQLEQCPASRMTEEMFKILGSGASSRILQQCDRLGMLQFMLPEAERMIRDNRAIRESFFSLLGLLDELVRDGEQRKARMLAYLSATYLYEVSSHGREERISFRDAFADVKEFIRPMVPANKDVEQALVHLIRRRKVYREAGILERPDDAARSREQHARDPEPRESTERQRSRRRRSRPGGNAKPRPLDTESPRTSAPDAGDGGTTPAERSTLPKMDPDLPE